MGGGYWKRDDFARYSAGMGRKVRSDGHIDTFGMRSAQDMYRARGLSPDLDPYKVTRECCDSEEHPQTVPVILALDVTGSMGGALLKTASSLGVIMQDILDKYGPAVCMASRVPYALSDDLGDNCYIVRLEKKADIDAFFKFATK